MIVISNITNFFSDFIPHIEWGEKSDSKVQQIFYRIFLPFLLPATYVHELGHAISGKSLYSNVKVRIKLFLNGGGTTSYMTGGAPSKIGEYFSSKTRKIIVCAAGPLATVVYAKSLAILGECSGDPIICAGLKTLATIHLMNEIGYAVSGITDFSVLNGAHDFNQLKMLGIHPIFPIVGMMGIMANCLLIPTEQIQNADVIKIF